MELAKLTGALVHMLTVRRLIIVISDKPQTYITHVLSLTRTLSKYLTFFPIEFYFESKTTQRNRH